MQYKCIYQDSSVTRILFEVMIMHYLYLMLYVLLRLKLTISIPFTMQGGKTHMNVSISIFLYL